jgi:hypothetical protein
MSEFVEEVIRWHNCFTADAVILGHPATLRVSRLPP